MITIEIFCDEWGCKQSEKSHHGNISKLYEQVKNKGWVRTFGNHALNRFHFCSMKHFESWYNRGNKSRYVLQENGVIKVDWRG